MKHRREPAMFSRFLGFQLRFVLPDLRETFLLQVLAGTSRCFAPDLLEKAALTVLKFLKNHKKQVGGLIRVGLEVHCFFLDSVLCGNEDIHAVAAHDVSAYSRLYGF